MVKKGELELLTTIGQLRRIPTRRPGPPLRERSPNLAQPLGRRVSLDPLVPGQDNLLLGAVLALDLCPDGHDLVVKVAGVLRGLGALEALGGVGVEVLPRE